MEIDILEIDILGADISGDDILEVDILRQAQKTTANRDCKCKVSCCFQNHSILPYASS